MTGICDFYETPGIYMFAMPMSQSFAELVLWERLLTEHPVSSVVEIGTGEGGFSRFLAVQASFRGFKFATFDIVEPVVAAPGFQKVDVIAETSPVLVALAPPAILFCDGGNKAAEMNLYAPLLSPGDLLVVHDWGTEVGPDDVPGSLLEDIHADWTFELRSMARVFRRIPWEG